MEAQQQKYIYIGIRKEDKSVWERRVAVTPQSVKKILQDNKNIQFIVQPSQRRAFQDSQYKEAGAEISEDLSRCSLIIGVKEVPQTKFQENTTYLIFSHTIKAQPYQMPLLDEMLQKNVRLIDYERITDDKNVRLIAFGRYAGIAGVLDSFGGLGKFLLHKGWTTPFLKIPQSYTYQSIEQSYSYLQSITKQYSQPGQQLVPDDLCPMVFAITGKGRCAMGAFEVLQNLPIKEVGADELKQLHQNKNDPEHKKQIYVTFIEEEQMVQPKDKNHIMTRPDYYQNPEKYEAIFFQKYFPYVSVIYHNIYWEEKYPRLITNDQIKDYFEQNQQNNFIGVIDVTCDFQGSIQFLNKFTTPDEPFWTYNPITAEVKDGPTYYPGTILYQSLDFLPCELAEDASQHFSSILEEWLVNIAESDLTLEFEKQNLLPQIERAVITSQGKLTKNYEYIAELRKQNNQ